jgi:hypothetical protein
MNFREFRRTGPWPILFAKEARTNKSGSLKRERHL